MSNSNEKSLGVTAVGFNVVLEIKNPLSSELFVLPFRLAFRTIIGSLLFYWLLRLGLDPNNECIYDANSSNKKVGRSKSADGGEARGWCFQ